jgi:hypothetical protein
MTQDLRPVGAGLLLWNDQGKALLFRDMATELYNLYDVGAVPRLGSPLDYMVTRFRLDTGLDLELVMHQILTFVRPYASAHDCKIYHVFVGSATLPESVSISGPRGSLEWCRLERLAPKECHPAFRYELPHYLKLAR